MGGEGTHGVQVGVGVGVAPRYFLVGAFTTFSTLDAMDAYVTAEQHMRASGLEGPIPLEQCVDEDKRTVYLAEILSSKSSSETIPAIKRMIARVQRYHRCQCVYRLHSDRALELVGKQVIDAMAEAGIEVTSTVGYDPDGNGRAERGVRWIKDKARTYLSGLNPPENRLWPFAVVHSSEVQLRNTLSKTNVGTQFEFGQQCLSLERNPVDPWIPKYQEVQYLGLVPGITHGHFVRHKSGVIQVSGNLKHLCDFKNSAFSGHESPAQVVSSAEVHQDDPFSVSAHEPSTGGMGISSEEIPVVSDQLNLNIRSGEHSSGVVHSGNV